MYKYKYQGKTAIMLPRYGLVTPNETIEVNFVINNPLFREVKNRKKK